MNSANAGIPYVPEGTLDPAAGLNDSIRVIDALLQPGVVDMVTTVPPSGAPDGTLYIVGAGATGAWAGHANDLAQYVEDGDFWQFYEAGSQVKVVINLADGLLYVYSDVDSPAGWAVIVGGGGGGTDSGHGDLTTLAIASNVVNLDHDDGADFDLQLTSNVTTFNHTNVQPAGTSWFSIRIRQDGVGSRTFAPPASWKYPSGVGAYSPTAAANAVDVVQGVSYNGGTSWLISYEKDYV